MGLRLEKVKCILSLFLLSVISRFCLIEGVLCPGPSQRVCELTSVINWCNSYQAKWDFNVPLNLLHPERDKVSKVCGKGKEQGFNWCLVMGGSVDYPFYFKRFLCLCNFCVINLLLTGSMIITEALDRVLVLQNNQSLFFFWMSSETIVWIQIKCQCCFSGVSFVSTVLQWKVRKHLRGNICRRAQERVTLTISQA